MLSAPSGADFTLNASPFQGLLLNQTAFIILFSLTAAFGQSTGDLNGHVYDSGEVAVAAAELTIENEETGVVRRSRTDAQGRYQFSLLPVGLYFLYVEKPRFAPCSRSGIRIGVASVATFDVILSRAGSGGHTERGDEARLETGNAARGTTIDGPLLRNLPKAARVRWGPSSTDPSDHRQESPGLLLPAVRGRPSR
jgi:hypothetical protein